MLINCCKGRSGAVVKARDRLTLHAHLSGRKHVRGTRPTTIEGDAKVLADVLREFATALGADGFVEKFGFTEIDTSATATLLPVAPETVARETDTTVARDTSFFFFLIFLFKRITLLLSLFVYKCTYPLFTLVKLRYSCLYILCSDVHSILFIFFFK